MRAAFMFLILSLFAGLGPARATSLEQYEVAGWHVGAYTNETTGAFSHCAMSAEYRSGIMLLFTVNSSYRWNLGFSNRNWNLAPDSTYPLTLYVDGRGPIDATATAISQNQVVVPIDDNGPLFQRFRKGYRLTVYAAGDTFEFNLDGTSAGLASLVECTNRHTMRASQPTQQNPFVASQVAPTATSGEFRAEATTVVANLLSLAGETGYHILEVDERPTGFESYDVVWEGQGYIGAMNVYPDAPLSSDVIAEILGNDAKSCRGSYGSQRLAPLPDDNLGTESALSACKLTDYTAIAYYTVLPRGAGGSYVTYVITLGDQEMQQQAEAVDRNLRSAAFTFLDPN